MREDQPEVTQLTDEERFQLLTLLDKVGYQRTGTEVFERFWNIMAMNPAELAVVRKIDDVDHVLMWRRKDVHYDGWHMPGGYILRGESDEQWIARVLGKETGLKLKNFHFIRRFNTRPETGWVPNHQMACFFKVEVEGEPSRGTFFPLTALPDDALDQHRQYIQHLRAYLMRMKTMREDGIRADHFARADQWKWALVVWGEGEALRIAQQFSNLDEATHALRMKLALANFSNYYCLVDDQGLQIL